VSPNNTILSINPRNHIETLLNSKYINLNSPKNPIFNTMAASKALISVLTSTCTSGSQTCNGQIGYLIANIRNRRIQTNIFRTRLSKYEISMNAFKSSVLKWNIVIKQISIHNTELKELKIMR
jgi:hypothetical protein